MTPSPRHATRDTRHATLSPSGLPIWTASLLIPGWAQLIQLRLSVFLWLLAALAAWTFFPRYAFAVHLLSALDALTHDHRRAAFPDPSNPPDPSNSQSPSTSHLPPSTSSEPPHG